MKQSYTDLPLPPAWKEAFKDADIRGEYEQEINEALAYAVAVAYVEDKGIKTIVVGRDMRVSSPSLATAFIAGARDAGADVIDLGLVTTPMVYFVSGNESLHGVMVTASHNPAHSNGLKLVLPGAIPLTNKTGLSAILKRIKAGSGGIHKGAKGSLKKQSVHKAYQRYVKSKVVVPSSRPNILVDAGNGMGSLLLPLLKDYAEVTALFSELDGTFPNRASNPTLAKNQKAIKASLKEGGYDLGISFDGDADRVAFFDEKGTYINAAHVGAFLAQYFLADHPKATFVTTTLNSRIFSEVVKEAGGRVVEAKVGHAFIKEAMRAKDAYFGCENSAHYYFKDNFYADSGIMMVLHTIAALVPLLEEGFTLSTIFKSFAPYVQLEEMMVEVTDKDATLDAITKWAESQPGVTVRHFDGVVMESIDWWASVKKSVTEDALKFVVESPQKKIAQEKQKEILTILKVN